MVGIIRVVEAREVVRVDVDVRAVGWKVEHLPWRHLLYRPEAAEAPPRHRRDRHMERRRYDRCLKLDALREQHDVALARRRDRVLEPRDIIGALDEAPPPWRKDRLERELMFAGLGAGPARESIQAAGHDAERRQEG